ncbi:hypothetical protein [Actinomadura kijaniata]|uniref:hypothetical protein n=1 Tax=Actinomadura kijaniata TaxID=46161 RepID=UPI00083401CB|nr:hypothetical protein [Actinomadura kijaniata]
MPKIEVRHIAPLAFGSLGWIEGYTDHIEELRGHQLRISEPCDDPNSVLINVEDRSSDAIKYQGGVFRISVTVSRVADLTD